MCNILSIYPLFVQVLNQVNSSFGLTEFKVHSCFPIKFFLYDTYVNKQALDFVFASLGCIIDEFLSHILFIVYIKSIAFCFFYSLLTALAK